MILCFVCGRAARFTMGAYSAPPYFYCVRCRRCPVHCRCRGGPTGPERYSYELLDTRVRPVEIPLGPAWNMTYDTGPPNLGGP